MFHCEIQNDHRAIAEEMENYAPIPRPREVGNGDIVENYLMIKAEIDALLKEECEKILGRVSETKVKSKKDNSKGDNNKEQLVSL